MKRLFQISIIILAILAGNLSAQSTRDVTKLPGYINLDKIKIPKSAEEVTDISIGPGLLSLISRVASDSSEKKSFSGILSIRVKSFEIDSTISGKVLKSIKEIIRKIEKENWETIVKVKDKNEITNISIKVVKGKPVGLLIISYDTDGEVTLANVCGEKIDLSAIKNIGMGFDDYSDKLDDFNF